MWAYVHAIFRHGFLYRQSPDMPASVFMTMDVCLPNKRPPRAQVAQESQAQCLGEAAADRRVAQMGFPSLSSP